MLVKWLHKLQGGSVKLLPDDVRPSSNGTKPARKRGGVYGPDNPHWTQLAKNKAKLRRVTKLANAAAVAANTGTTRK
jgi:hypothetical protein